MIRPRAWLPRYRVELARHIEAAMAAIHDTGKPWVVFKSTRSYAQHRSAGMKESGSRMAQAFAKKLDVKLHD